MGHFYENATLKVAAARVTAAARRGQLLKVDYTQPRRGP